VAFVNLVLHSRQEAGPFDCAQGLAFGLGISDDKLRRGKFPTPPSQQRARRGPRFAPRGFLDRLIRWSENKNLTAKLTLITLI
jgi:hypothetical protein